MHLKKLKQYAQKYGNQVGGLALAVVAVRFLSLFSIFYLC